MSFTLYIIYSTCLDRYYVGYTSHEVTFRLSQHNANHKGFTGKQADWQVKYTESYATKSVAMKRERQIKAWKSRVKIQELLSIE